jgi:hypothetical protein
MGELRVADCVKNAAGAQIAGTCPSDERLKTNIEPFSPLLSRLVQLQPLHFDWRAVEYPDSPFGSERGYGLIAQQVEQVFPELVSRDKNGFKAVNYSELPLLPFQAVRELECRKQMDAGTTRVRSAAESESGVPDRGAGGAARHEAALRPTCFASFRPRAARAADGVLRGHPSIFSSDVADASEAQPGDAVRVLDPRGKLLGNRKGS